MNKLYQDALTAIEEGRWEAPHKLFFQDTSTGKRYYFCYCKSFPFELGTVYISSKYVTYVMDEAHERFYENAVIQTEAIYYPSLDLKDQFNPFMPSIAFHFKAGDKYYYILRKDKHLINLSDLLAHYDGTIPDRHATWIISRLCNICCFFHSIGIVHNGLTIENCYISPSDHTVSILGGWWYATAEGAKMIGASKAIYDIMPVTTKSDKLSTPKTDLESVKLIGRLIFDKGATPTPILEFLNSGSTTAVNEFKKWDKALTDAYGERRFIPMNVSAADIYKIN